MDCIIGSINFQLQGSRPFINPRHGRGRSERANLLPYIVLGYDLVGGCGGGGEGEVTRCDFLHCFLAMSGRFPLFLVFCRFLFLQLLLLKILFAYFFISSSLLVIPSCSLSFFSLLPCVLLLLPPSSLLIVTR